MNYQQINLDEYSLSGAGGTALTYTHKQEKRLAKLFTPGFAADMASQNGTWAFPGALPALQTKSAATSRSMSILPGSL